MLYESRDEFINFVLKRDEIHCLKRKATINMLMNWLKQIVIIGLHMKRNVKYAGMSIIKSEKSIEQCLSSNKTLIYYNLHFIEKRGAECGTTNFR